MLVDEDTKRLTLPSKNLKSPVENRDKSTITVQCVKGRSRVSFKVLFEHREALIA